MARYETRTTIEFTRREAVTLNDVRGAILRVKRGTVWVTQEAESRDAPAQDIVLRSGDAWVVETSGATVLEAQDAATVYVVGCAVNVPKRKRQPGAVLRAIARLWNPWFLPPRHVPYY
jgi:hypothetical protein